MIFKQMHLTHRWDLNRYSNARMNMDLGVMAMYWFLKPDNFDVTPWTPSFERVVPHCKRKGSVHSKCQWTGYEPILTLVYTSSLALSIECLSMAQEKEVRSHVESYQRLKKMELDAVLLNTHHYKLQIKGKVEQSRENNCTLPNTSVK